MLAPLLDDYCDTADNATGGFRLLDDQAYSHPSTPKHPRGGDSAHHPQRSDQFTPAQGEGLTRGPPAELRP